MNRLLEIDSDCPEYSDDLQAPKMESQLFSSAWVPKIVAMEQT